MRAHASRRALRIFTVSLVAAPSFFASQVSEAAPKLAGDLHAVVPVDATSVEAGVGGALRLGYELHLPGLALTPEIGGGYDSFGGTLGPRIARGFAGARLGVGEALRPGVFAHVGFGHVGFGSLPAAVPDPSHTALALDGGVFLDLTLLPILDLGVHASYNTVGGGDAPGATATKWIAAGAHVAIAF